jgi:hypothetical protein
LLGTIELLRRSEAKGGFVGLSADSAKVGIVGEWYNKANIWVSDFVDTVPFDHEVSIRW